MYYVKKVLPLHVLPSAKFAKINLNFLPPRGTSPNELKIFLGEVLSVLVTLLKLKIFYLPYILRKVPFFVTAFQKELAGFCGYRKFFFNRKVS